MRSRSSNAGSSTNPVPLIALVLLLALGGSLVITHTDPGLGLGAALLLIMVFASFLNTEMALHIILLSMLLSPEIVVGGIGGVSIGKPMYKGDALVLRIEDLILTAVTFAWLARTAIFKELGVIKRTPLNAPMFAYIVSMLLATLLGVFRGNVLPIRGFFFAVKYFEYFVVFFMTVNYLQDRRQLKRLLATAFVTCAISAIMGILQIPSGERVGAPFEGQYGEPNTFGGYLVLMLALILAQALSSREALPAFGWVAFAGLVSLPLLFTLSRSSWLAAIPVLLILLVGSPRRLTLMAGLGILLIVGAFALPKQVVDRYNYTLNAKEDRGEYKIAGSRLDTSTSARLESWGTAFDSWTRHPFFGYGVAGYGFVDAQYFRVLVESGLAGMASFLWLLWRLGQVGWRGLRSLRGSELEGLPLGYLAGLVALITHAIGANTFIIVRIMEPFWFLTGIIVILPSMSWHDGVASAMTKEDWRPQRAHDQHPDFVG